MKVSLIDFTGMGNPDPWHAIHVLLFTKQTRLTMSPSLFEEIKEWTYLKKMEELEYMANTIPSSWEFIDYTFLIEGVTRAFTHQFVRSRQWSFAQQTMRVLDVSTGTGWDYDTGPSISNNSALQANYDATMAHIDRAYKFLIRDGAKIEDARGILPTNILTNIVGKCNMRTFVDTIHKRSSPRTQDEYRNVLERMKQCVQEVHPWMAIFLNRTADEATNDLQQHISTIPEQDKKIAMTKLLDQLRAKL